MTPGLTPLDALPVLLGTHWIAGQVLHVLRGPTAARTRQPRCSLLTVRERGGNAPLGEKAVLVGGASAGRGGVGARDAVVAREEVGHGVSVFAVDAQVSVSLDLVRPLVQLIRALGRDSTRCPVSFSRVRVFWRPGSALRPSGVGEASMRRGTGALSKLALHDQRRWADPPARGLGGTGLGESAFTSWARGGMLRPRPKERVRARECRGEQPNSTSARASKDPKPSSVYRIRDEACTTIRSASEPLPPLCPLPLNTFPLISLGVAARAGSGMSRASKASKGREGGGEGGRVCERVSESVTCCAVAVPPPAPQEHRLFVC